jgi:rhodanese-related sulfurtransferase
MREVNREEVQRLLLEGAQLVEVLPTKEYAADHLPGAISLPLRKLDAGARAIMDTKKPIIVYCWDSA